MRFKDFSKNFQKNSLSNGIILGEIGGNFWNSLRCSKICKIFFRNSEDFVRISRISRFFKTLGILKIPLGLFTKV